MAGHETEDCVGVVAILSYFEKLLSRLFFIIYNSNRLSPFLVKSNRFLPINAEPERPRPHALKLLCERLFLGGVRREPKLNGPASWLMKERGRVLACKDSHTLDLALLNSW